MYVRLLRSESFCGRPLCLLVHVCHGKFTMTTCVPLPNRMRSCLVGMFMYVGYVQVVCTRPAGCKPSFCIRPQYGPYVDSSLRYVLDGSIDARLLVSGFGDFLRFCWNKQSAE